MLSYYHFFFDGGSRKPVLDDDALQWVVGYESDGDYTDKLVGVASPTVYNARSISFGGSQYGHNFLDYPINDIPDAKASFHCEFKTNSAWGATLEFIFCRGSGGSTATDYGLFVNTNGDLYWQTGPSIANGDYWNITNLSLSTEYDVWVTIDTATKQKTAVINGTPYNTAYVDKAVSGLPLVIGAGSEKDAFFFEGQIHRLEIYDKITTSSDDSSVRYYPMSEGFSSKIHDVAQPTLEEIELIIIWGQSNAVGGSFGTEPPPSPYDVPQDDYLYSYYVGGDTDQGIALQGLSDNRWTAELPLGKYLTDTYGSRKRAIFKFAVNGASLGNYLGYGLAGYRLFKDNLHLAILDLQSRGYNPTVTNFITFQGETDMESAIGTNYKANWDAFWAGLVSETIVSEDTKVIAVRTVNSAGVEPYATSVRDAQELIGASPNAWIDSDSWVRADGVHVQEAGKLDWGTALESEVADFVPSGDIRLNGNGDFVGSVLSYRSVAYQNIFSYSLYGGFTPAMTKSSTAGVRGETGITGLTSDTQWEVVFRLNSVSTGRNGLAGNASIGNLHFGVNVDTWLFGNGNTITTSIAADTDTHTVKLDTSDGKCYLDGVVVATGTGLAEFIYDPWLFCLNAAGTQLQNSDIEIYSSKITVGGSVLQNLIPRSDGVFYDTISEVTISNTGSSVFQYTETPAYIDAGAVANGLAITNPGGYPHNVAENLTNQTDADEAVFGGVSAWGDGLSWTPLSYASMTTHPNGYLGLWFDWKQINGVWVVKEWLQYTVDREFTPSETLQNERYFTPYDGAETAALRDVDGELVLDVNGYTQFTAG